MADTKTSVAEEEASLRKRVAEFARTKHSRQLIEALDNGWIPQGTRLIHPGDKENGLVIVLSHEEAALLVEPLRKIATTRIEGNSK